MEYNRDFYVTLCILHGLAILNQGHAMNSDQTVRPPMMNKWILRYIEGSGYFQYKYDIAVVTSAFENNY